VVLLLPGLPDVVKDINVVVVDLRVNVVVLAVVTAGRRLSLAVRPSRNRKKFDVFRLD
jgi:hypothetical protein